MIVELGVGVLTVGAAGYAIYWQRRRARWARMPRWAKMREEQDRIDSLWNEVHREELRLKRQKKMEETGRPSRKAMKKRWS